MKYLTIPVIILILIGCANKPNKKTSKIEFEKIPLNEAKGFEVYKSGDLVKIIVKNPWQNAQNIEFEYLLTNSDSVFNFLNSEFEIIKTPVKRIVCFSTTYIGFIDLLNNNSSIVGLSGTDYVFNSEIKKLISERKIVDIGNDQDINYELIMSLKPDVVFLYGIENEISNKIEKFKSLGIKTIMIGEYLEQTPLAKTEWLKFFSLFYNKFDLADSLFSELESKYKSLLKITDTIKYTPKVLVNVPYQGIWYLPGGKSYMANFIKDAGGLYSWSENTENESFPLDFENILFKSQDAEILINPGVYENINQIVGIDSRIENINAIKIGKVFNNNKRQNQYGGNDFWESGIVQPEIILKDLIKIFHPQFFFQDSLYFYKKLD